MPIEIQYNPSPFATGRMAAQTGQLEYRNQRRRELEKLAMQQAEMAQRARMQREQLSAQQQRQNIGHLQALNKGAWENQWGMQDDQRWLANQKELNNQRFLNNQQLDADGWAREQQKFQMGQEAKDELSVQQRQEELDDRVRDGQRNQLRPDFQIQFDEIWSNAHQAKQEIGDRPEEIAQIDQQTEEQVQALMKNPAAKLPRNQYNPGQILEWTSEYTHSRADEDGTLQEYFTGNRKLEDGTIVPANVGEYLQSKVISYPAKRFNPNRDVNEEELGNNRIVGEKIYGPDGKDVTDVYREQYMLDADMITQTPVYNPITKRIEGYETTIGSEEKFKETERTRDTELHEQKIQEGQLDIQKKQWDLDHPEGMQPQRVPLAGTADAEGRIEIPQQPNLQPVPPTPPRTILSHGPVPEQPVSQPEPQPAPPTQKPSLGIDGGFQFVDDEIIKQVPAQRMREYNGNGEPSKATGIYQVPEQDRRSVYEYRKKLANRVGWPDMLEIDEKNLSRAMATGQLSFGDKIDLSEINNDTGRAFARKWEERTGTTDLIVTKALLENIGSLSFGKRNTPSFRAAEHKKYMERINQQEKEYYNFYGRSEDFEQRFEEPPRPTPPERTSGFQNTG
jgi:hypothetical protein